MLKSLLFGVRKFHFLFPSPNVQCKHVWINKQKCAKLDDQFGKVRKTCSNKKNDFSTPHPPKDPPEPYCPEKFRHKAFTPPKCIPLEAFRKFQSSDEVLGPDAGKTKDYKNPEYFSYHRFSFVMLQNASLKIVQIEPNLKEKEEAPCENECTVDKIDEECRNPAEKKKQEQCKIEVERLRKEAERYEKEECAKQKQKECNKKAEVKGECETQPKMVSDQCKNEDKEKKEQECQKAAEKKNHEQYKMEVERLRKEAERYEKEDCEKKKKDQCKTEVKGECAIQKNIASSQCKNEVKGECETQKNMVSYQCRNEDEECSEALKKQKECQREAEKLQEEAERYEKEECEKKNQGQCTKEVENMKMGSSDDKDNQENNPAVIIIYKRKSRTCDPNAEKNEKDKDKDENNKK